VGTHAPLHPVCKAPFGRACLASRLTQARVEGIGAHEPGNPLSLDHQTQPIVPGTELSNDAKPERGCCNNKNRPSSFLLPRTSLLVDLVADYFTRRELVFDQEGAG
jgi:hypothetical protein